jgi:hypothetical protein
MKSQEMTQENEIESIKRRAREGNSIFRAAAVRKLIAEIDRLDNGTRKAIAIAINYGGIDGAHHKDWVIDQMLRALTGDDYAKVVKDACAGENGPDTYSWNVGIAP